MRFRSRMSRWLGALVFSCAVLAAGPAAAQDTPELETASETLDENFQASVIVDGVELFVLRGTSALPAEERAQNVSEAIVAAAEASDADSVRITTARDEFGINILADGRNLVLVTEAEAELEQMDIELLVGTFVDAIERAILNYRADRTEEAITSGAIEAGLWTLGFALFTWLVLLVRRRANLRATDLAHRHFSGFESATNAQVQAEAVAALARFGISVILFSLLFLGAYYYISFVLLAFAETRYVAEILLTYVTAPVMNILLGFVGYLPNLVTLIIIALVTKFILKGISVFFDAVEAGTFKLGEFEPHWVAPTYSIVRVLVILIALVFAFPYIPGSDSAAFQGLTILLGAMLSLGANSVVNNMLSGLFVIYRRSTSIGDRIKIGPHVGDVVQIKMMETHLKSIKNELISIPNAQLLNSEVINYSKMTDRNGLLIHVTVGIGYEEPFDKIEAMLVEAALRTEGLKLRPKPFVLWEKLADFAINYQINAYAQRNATFPKVRSELNRNIVTVFNENGVQIMTPAYEADPPEPKIPEANWEGRLAHQAAPARKRETG